MGIFTLFYFVDGFTVMSCVAVILAQGFLKDGSNVMLINGFLGLAIMYCMMGIVIVFCGNRLLM